MSVEEDHDSDFSEGGVKRKKAVRGKKIQKVEESDHSQDR